MDEFNVEKERNNENKKNLLIIGSVILILVILGIAGYFIFKNATSNSKKIFTTAIDNVYNIALKKIDDNNKDLVGGTLKIQTNLSSKDNDINNVLKIVNDLSLSYNFGLDINAKKGHIDLDTTYKNKNLLSLSVDTEDSIGYVYLKDIYDKYLSIPIDDFDSLFEINQFYDDYKVVLENIKKALDVSIKDEYFTTTDTKILVDGKNIDVTKHSLVLDENNLEKFSKDLSKELNNQEFISSLANISNISEDDIIDTLEEMASGNVTLEEGTVYISIYTKDLEFVALEMNDNIDTFKIIKNNETNYSYELKSLDFDIQGTFDLKIKDNDFDFTISFNYDELSGSVTISFTESNDIIIPNIDMDNVINYQDISESDATKIMNNLENNEVIMDLAQGIMSIFMQDLNI